MFKKLSIIGLALLFLAPSILLVTIGALINPAQTSNATCLASVLTFGAVPDELVVTDASGYSFTLKHQQPTHAATIITTGSSIEGGNRDGVQIALMAALTESTLRMLSNTTHYPESADYPNDGDGSDNDSLGLFQMRPAAGWGTVADLMDPDYQVRAFFGGPTGPNYPSPRGLLDISGWESMDKGEAAQDVEVIVYPDRYRNYQPVAEQILQALTTNTSQPTDGFRARVRWTDPYTHKRVGRVAHVRSSEEVEEFFDQMRAATETGADTIISLGDYAASIGDRWQRGLDPTSTAELYETGLR